MTPTDPPATSRQGARRGSPDGFPATPATEAGEALYRWFRGKSEITGNRLDAETARHIAEVEAEAARDALRALRGEVEGLAPYDETDRITALNGTVRQPVTPADYVDAYRTRLIAALDRLLAERQ